MSISVELPSAMEREVLEFVQGQGKTLDQLFIDYLHDEMIRRRGASQTDLKCWIASGRPPVPKVVTTDLAERDYG